MKKLVFAFGLFLTSAAWAVDTPTATPTPSSSFTPTSSPTITGTFTPTASFTKSPVPVVAKVNPSLGAPAYQWRGNSSPGRLVGSYGGNLTQLGNPLWKSASQVPGCEGDHWLFGADESLNGASYYYALPSNFKFAPGAWSIRFSIKGNGSNAGVDVLNYDTIGNRRVSGLDDERWFYLWVINGDVYVDYTYLTNNAGSGNATQTNNGTLSDGNVHDVVIEGDATGVYCFIDGVKDSNFTSNVVADLGESSTPWDNDTRYLSLGAFNWTYGSGEYIYFDNFQVYRNIVFLYATPTPTITPSPIPTPNPVKPTGYHGAGNILQQDFAGAKSSSLTFTAVSGAATGVPLIPAIPGKIIMVTGWSISTDTQASIILHYGTGAVVNSPTASNFIAGGYFAAKSRDAGHVNLVAAPAPAVNQGVSVDFSGAISTVYVNVKYVVF